jgi:glyoxalase superfamily protein
MEVTYDGPEGALIAGDGKSVMFQQVSGYNPPRWPDPAHPQQAHLDLAVDDLASAGAFAESVGARRVHGPGTEQDFWVYLDPAGHPFCLCRTGAAAQGDGSGERG